MATSLLVYALISFIPALISLLFLLAFWLNKEVVGRKIILIETIFFISSLTALAIVMTHGIKEQQYGWIAFVTEAFITELAFVIYSYCTIKQRMGQVYS